MTVASLAHRLFARELQRPPRVPGGSRQGCEDGRHRQGCLGAQGEGWEGHDALQVTSLFVVCLEAEQMMGKTQPLVAQHELARPRAPALDHSKDKLAGHIRREEA